MLTVACGGRVIAGGEGGGGAGASSGVGGQGGSGGNVGQLTSDKVDLLFVIDNSRSMADKQELLGFAVSDLLRGLINPLCVDVNGVPTAQQPNGPLEGCAEGKRVFPPVVDIHVGVISSSLGGHGADACSAVSNQSENDHAHLLNRTSTNFSTPPIATWADAGFLVWDPGTPATHTPPGQSDVDTLMSNIFDMVNGVGEVGCGYESQLESWYRFLIEPDPYESISLEGNTVVLNGTDAVLLQQRRDFLRPDSLLTVVMLSDENDCSIRDGGQFYFAGQIYTPGSSNQPYHLPNARAACANDPASVCCRSCGQGPGAGCDDSLDDCNGALGGLEDHINMRCFEQKRRFGIDFLQPISRYITGLNALQVPDRFGNPQPNPIFSNLSGAPADVRNSSLVVMSAIVGVPWHDIARRDASGSPNLLGGLDEKGAPVGGLQNASQLAANGVWNLIAGNVDAHIPPQDPFMVESWHPRSGTNPITGDSIQPPSAGEGAAPINGHEFTNPFQRDLQYACIFPLLEPRDCGPGSTATACDCDDAGNDNPLCVANPTDNGYNTLQKYAKAYPALRQLNVLKGIGTQAALGSVCAAQVSNTTLADFGYRPSSGAILEAMRIRLAAP